MDFDFMNGLKKTTLINEPHITYFKGYMTLTDCIGLHVEDLDQIKLAEERGDWSSTQRW